MLSPRQRSRRRRKPESLAEPSTPFGGSFCLFYQARSPVVRRPNTNLPLAQVGVTLFSPKESHRRLIFDIRAIHDGNHLAPGANSVACTNVLSNLLEVAVLWIPVAPDVEPQLVVRHVVLLVRRLKPARCSE